MPLIASTLSSAWSASLLVSFDWLRKLMTPASVGAAIIDLPVRRAYHSRTALTGAP